MKTNEQNNEETTFDGTVLQLSFDGKQWKHQLNILAGNLFPEENLIINQKNTLTNLFNILTSKNGIFYVLGFGVFFGYLVYKYVYISRRRKKDIVDFALEGRFKF
eukprot:gene12709-6907_t